MTKQKSNEDRATYTIPESAELLGIGRNQAYEAARQGQIPIIKIGKRYLVPKVALMKLLQIGAASKENPVGAAEYN